MLLRQTVADATPILRAGFALLWLICVAAVLMLAGCKEFGSSSLEFTPRKLPACEGRLIVVHVRWNFEAATRKPVSIYVSSPGGKPKLWSVTLPKGEANTGRWMHDGSTIVIRDSKGRLLGIRTLEAASCKSGLPNT